MITAFIDFLAQFYQTGNLAQMEVIARSMLAAIPDDLVALQFLGLALYQTGRFDEAYRALKRAADIQDLSELRKVSPEFGSVGTVVQREATRAYSGLADGWSRIAQILRRFRMYKSSNRAFEAALASGGAAAPLQIQGPA